MWWDNGKTNVFLDACAAPGNKTTHLAAIVNSTSKEKTKNTVVALDRSGDRIKILQKRVSLLAPDAVSPLHLDFLKTEHSDPRFSKLKAILLDPSCSGSGIVNSPDRAEEDDTAERLNSLSNFQLLALLHAMSFPQVNYVAYSTCSVNNEENEAVVSKALQEANANLKGGEVWELRRPLSLEKWSRRGEAVEGLTEEQANCLCRCDPFDGDETNGFFVSYFARVKAKRGAEVAADVGSGPLGGAVPIYRKGLFVSSSSSGSGSGSDKGKKRKMFDRKEERKERKEKKEEEETKVTEGVSHKIAKVVSDAKVPDAKAGGGASKKAAKARAFKAKQREKKLARLKKKQDAKQAS